MSVRIQIQEDDGLQLDLSVPHMDHEKLLEIVAEAVRSSPNGAASKPSAADGEAAKRGPPRLAAADAGGMHPEADRQSSTEHFTPDLPAARRAARRVGARTHSELLAVLTWQAEESSLGFLPREDAKPLIAALSGRPVDSQERTIISNARRAGLVEWAGERNQGIRLTKDGRAFVRIDGSPRRSSKPARKRGGSD